MALGLRGIAVGPLASLPTPTGPSDQTLTQSSTFTNSNTFYTHALTYDQTLTQSATFTGTNSFFTHTLTRGTVTLTQSATYTNTNQFFTHSLAAGAVTLTQSSTYTNSPTFFTHVLTNAGGGAQTLTQTATFTDTNSFFTHTLTAGDVALAQSSTYTGSNQFFTHALSAGSVTLNQSSTFTGTPSFFTHALVPGAVTLNQSAVYTATNSFFTHVISQSGTLTVDDVWNYAVEGSYTVGDVFRIMAATLAGKASGAEGSTITFTGMDDLSPRVVSDVDTFGDRTTVTLSPGSNTPTGAPVNSASSVWDYVLDGGYTAKELLRLMASASAGKVSGASGATVVFRGLYDTKDRIIATTDSAGNRTAIVRDVT